MVIYRDDYLIDEPNVAICGKYAGGDAIHVGIYWNSEGENKIVHFINGTNIPVEDISLPKFQHYFFNRLIDFPEDLIPSLAGIADLISENKLNGLIFSKNSTVYNGEKFSFLNGAYDQNPTVGEKYINCGIFALALLNSFIPPILDWNSWPNIFPENPKFLDAWLIHYNIPVPLYPYYYNQAKEIRGRHIFTSPSTTTQPSTYNENEALSQQLLAILSP
nr:hypothetical protein [uncultured Flavobacterium sp.]